MMLDQPVIRVCLIIGSLVTAGYILQRVRSAKVQIEDTIFWLLFSGVLLILAVYYVLFGFSLYQFLAASYANACFDRFLNPRIEGADVNKGLRDPSYNEEDDTVTDEDIKNL